MVHDGPAGIPVGVPIGGARGTLRRVRRPAVLDARPVSRAAVVVSPENIGGTLDPRAAPAQPRFMGKGTLVATVLAVLLGCVLGVLHVDASSLAPLVVLTATYLSLATFGMVWAERRGAPHLWLLLSAQVPLVAGVVWLSEGSAFVAAMPLVSMFVSFSRLRTALALAAALTVFFAWTVACFTGTGLALQAAIGFGSSAAFVIVFSQLVRRERLALAQVERLASDLRHANAQLREYVTQVEELATTKERNRIAREVHDSLGHYLTVASMQLEAARTSSSGDEAARARLDRVQELLREGLGELRRSVSMLRVTPSSPQAFAHAIAELVRESTASGLATTWTTEGEPRPLPGAVGFTLYRAAQEALTNARRHARARRDGAPRIRERDRRAPRLGRRSPRCEPEARQRSPRVTRAGRARRRFGPDRHGRRPRVQRDCADSTVRRIRVFVVDDQSLFREGISAVLSADPELEVVGEAPNGEEAVRACAELRPDVVLMDLKMPVLDGVAATRRLSVQQPRVKVVVLTTFDDDELVFEGLRAGAVGYLLKDASAARLGEVIRAAARGESFLQPSVASKVIAELSRLRARPSPPDSLLTPREREVVELLARGASNKEIAKALFLAEGIVKNHITNILEKLGVGSRTEAALKAKDLGLI